MGAAASWRCATCRIGNGEPDILSHDLTSGRRDRLARYPGSNISPAPSPDGSKVAMILEQGRARWIFMWRNMDGSNLRQLTKSTRGRVVAVLVAGRPMDLFRGQEQRAPGAVESAAGGRRAGADSDLRGFESVRAGLVAGREVDCVHRADGRVRDLRGAGRGRHGHAAGRAARTRPGRRTRARWCLRSATASGGRRLSLLDVPTKQTKDVSRISGSNSQPSWAK